MFAVRGQLFFIDNISQNVWNSDDLAPEDFKSFQEVICSLKKEKWSLAIEKLSCDASVAARSVFDVIIASMQQEAWGIVRFYKVRAPRLAT